MSPPPLGAAGPFPGMLGFGALLLRFGEGLGEGFGDAEGELDAVAEELTEALELAEALPVLALAKRSYSSGLNRCFHPPSS